MDPPPGRAPRLPRPTAEHLRFVAARALCTLASYALYLLLLAWLTYAWAYAIAFVAGIALSYVTSALFVFGTPMRTRSALRFPLVYLLQFVATFALLHVAVAWLGIAEAWALALAVLALLPVTFVLSRRVLRIAPGTEPPPAAPAEPRRPGDTPGRRAGG